MENDEYELTGLDIAESFKVNLIDDQCPLYI